MRSIPDFLLAFIITVIISGTLMIGCGKGSGGGNSSTGGAANSGANNTGSSNTASIACIADGGECMADSQCCNKNTGSVCRREPLGLGYNALGMPVPILGDYVCGKPLSNNNSAQPPASNNNNDDPLAALIAAGSSIVNTDIPCDLTPGSHFKGCPDGYSCNMAKKYDDGYYRCYKNQ
jgi:hypothetical protein